MRVQTLPELFQRAVHEHGPRTALRYPREGDWHPITYGQLGRLVEEATVGLAETELEPGDRVVLASEEGPQRAVAELATWHADAVTVALDPSDPGLGDAIDEVEPSLAFVDPGEIARELTDREDASPSTVVVLEGSPGRAEGPSPETDGGVRRLRGADLYRRGQKVLGGGEGVFARRWRGCEPGHAAELVQTGSGWVELTHRHRTANVRALASAWSVEPGDRALSACSPTSPLGRVTGRLALLDAGAETWLLAEASPEAVRRCRPRHLVADAAALGKLRTWIEERLEASEPLQRRLYDWATVIGRERVRAFEEGGLGLGLRLRGWAADGLVLAKVRAELGLEGAETVLTDAREPALGDWCRAIGLPLRTSYATAGAGLVTLERAGEAGAGSLGTPLPRVDVRIEGEGSTGEIRVRGASVAAGGDWLATGDRGRLDAEGRLHLVDD